MRRRDYDYPHGDVPRIPIELLERRIEPAHTEVALLWAIAIAIAALVGQAVWP
jgi:hypothetical protein